MPEDDAETQTFMQKLLFYTTAFFVLLGIFSLFAFLFLVPFVIDPAMQTIALEFDERPAFCETYDFSVINGIKNCSSWTSCREGCTREVFACTQIRVKYKKPREEEGREEREADEDEAGARSTKERRDVHDVEVLRPRRALRDYDYLDRYLHEDKDVLYDEPSELNDLEPIGLMGNASEWYYVGAELYPNVKGCGYPPMLNCTIWNRTHVTPGSNFSCYYSRVDPKIVITELDMAQVYLNLILSIAIPIPSFIASVIYLTFAYFKIYNEEEQEALVNDDEVVEGDVGTPVPALTSGAITPGSEAFREDLASFGHQLKVAMADEMSRESIIDDHPVVTNNSNHSLSGKPPALPPTNTALENTVNSFPEPETNLAPPPRGPEKATRPNALELKLGDFV